MQPRDCQINAVPAGAAFLFVAAGCWCNSHVLGSLQRGNRVFAPVRAEMLQAASRSSPHSPPTSPGKTPGVKTSQRLGSQRLRGRNSIPPFLFSALEQQVGWFSWRAGASNRRTPDPSPLSLENHCPNWDVWGELEREKWGEDGWSGRKSGRRARADWSGLVADDA